MAEGKHRLEGHIVHLFMHGTTHICSYFAPATMQKPVAGCEVLFLCILRESFIGACIALDSIVRSITMQLDVVRLFHIISVLLHLSQCVAFGLLFERRHVGAAAQ